MKMKPRYFFWIMSVMLTLAAFESLLAQIPDSEKQALLKIYKATDGANWNPDKIWNTKQSPSTWYGVEISESGHVKGIELTGAGLNGVLPGDAFSALPELESLFLGQNKDVKSNRSLKGKVPAEIMQLKKLKNLDLSRCEFSGMMPDLSTLTKLEYLDISMNNLEKEKENGTTAGDVFHCRLPDFNKLPNLTYFAAAYAGVQGTIPSSIGTCKKLIVLDLSGNYLTGSIPAELNKCSALGDLSLIDNELSGAIPYLGDLTKIGDPMYPSSVVLGRFYLAENKLSGDFPQWITSLTNMVRFTVSDNQLTGTLPEDLSVFKRLEIFFADHNNLTGKLPKKLPPKMDKLDLRSNLLEGNIPESWELCKALSNVQLGANNLAGYVPPIYKKLKQMDVIDIQFNRFTFEDFKDWKRFGKDAECSFRFGMQQPYSTKKTISAKTGEKVTFDATYPKPIPEEFKPIYTWYNLVTGREVKEAPHQPTFSIEKVSVKDVAKYACFITTEYFGKDPTGEGTRSADGALRSRTIPPLPILASGVFNLEVDGQTGTANIEQNSADAYVYPTTAQNRLNISAPEQVESVWIFTLNGEKVMMQPVTTAYVDVTPLSNGSYVVMLLMKDDTWRSQQITIRK